MAMRMRLIPGTTTWEPVEMNQSSNSSVQTAQTEYTLTQTDINNGYSIVHVTWPTLWEDSSFTQAYGVYDEDSIIDLSFITGDMHNITPAGFDAIVYFASALPLIQGQMDVANVNTTKSLSLTAQSSTLYMITIYIASRNDGLSTDKVEWSLTFTDEAGVQQTFTDTFGAIKGSGGSIFVDSSQNSSFPVFCKSGTPITVATLFAGTANPFHYDFSVRIVQMPNNSVVAQVGDKFVVNAISVHN